MPEKYWATCPNCGADIEYSSFSYDDYAGNEVYCTGSGKCPSCGKKWEWEEKFVLSEIHLYKEVREEEDY